MSRSDLLWLVGLIGYGVGWWHGRRRRDRELAVAFKAQQDAALLLVDDTARRTKQETARGIRVPGLN